MIRGERPRAGPRAYNGAMRIRSAGHAVFAATMMGLGIMGLAKGALSPIWDPLPKGVPAREALVYLCAGISLGCGIGILWRRTAGLAARVLLGCLLFWLLAFRLPYVIIAPGVDTSWSASETAVMAAAAWVLYTWFATGWDKKRLGFAGAENGRRIARVLYGLALIPFGVAHFVYLKHTADMVPGWLPGHGFWAYFTGWALIAGGVGVLLGVYARLAATLSAIEIGMFTLLVWGPVMAAGPKNPYQWSETVVSVALTAGAWVVADSYRGMRWMSARDTLRQPIANAYGA